MSGPAPGDSERGPLTGVPGIFSLGFRRVSLGARLSSLTRSRPLISPPSWHPRPELPAEAPVLALKSTYHQRPLASAVVDGGPWMRKGSPISDDEAESHRGLSSAWWCPVPLGDRLHRLGDVMFRESLSLPGSDAERSVTHKSFDFLHDPCEHA